MALPRFCLLPMKHLMIAQVPIEMDAMGFKMESFCKRLGGNQLQNSVCSVYYKKKKMCLRGNEPLRSYGTCSFSYLLNDRMQYGDDPIYSQKTAAPLL